MGASASVIEAYDDARAAGLSRANAFGRAVVAFRTLRPDLPVGEAGSEVARILLQAAVTERLAQGHGEDALPRPAISW